MHTSFTHRLEESSQHLHKIPSTRLWEAPSFLSQIALELLDHLPPSFIQPLKCLWPRGKRGDGL